MLKFGIYDRLSISEESYKNAWLIRKLCQQKHGSEESFNQAAGQLGLPIGDIPLAIGGSKKSGDFKSYYEAFCSGVDSGQITDEKLSSWSEKANVELASEFAKCVVAPGLHVWVEESASPKLFRLKASFVPSGTQTVANLTFGFQPEGSVKSCSPNLLGWLTKSVPVGLNTGWSLNTVCTRNEPGIIEIAVNSNYILSGGGALTVPAVWIKKSAPPRTGVTSAPLINSGDQIVLRTSKAWILNSYDSKGNVSAINTPDPASDEIFTINKVAGSGPLQHGDKVWIGTRHGYRFSCADSALDCQVKAVKTLAKSDNGQFTILRELGSGNIRHGDGVFFKTTTGYILNSNDSNGPLKASTAPNGGRDELFLIERRN